MMDGLSVVASVITLVTVVVEVVKKARTFYWASEELEELRVGLALSRSMLPLNDPFI